MKAASLLPGREATRLCAVPPSASRQRSSPGWPGALLACVRSALALVARAAIRLVREGSP